MSNLSEGGFAQAAQGAGTGLGNGGDTMEGEMLEEEERLWDSSEENEDEAAAWKKKRNEMSLEKKPKEQLQVL